MLKVKLINRTRYDGKQIRSVLRAVLRDLPVSVTGTRPIKVVVEPAKRSRWSYGASRDECRVSIRPPSGPVAVPIDVGTMAHHIRYLVYWLARAPHPNGPLTWVAERVGFDRLEPRPDVPDRPQPPAQLRRRDALERRLAGWRGRLAEHEANVVKAKRRIKRIEASLRYYDRAMTPEARAAAQVRAESRRVQVTEDLRVALDTAEDVMGRAFGS
jgi:hypothetical protein